MVFSRIQQAMFITILLAPSVNMRAADDEQPTTASTAQTVLASAGIFGGVATSILGNMTTKFINNNSNSDDYGRAVFYGVILVPAAMTILASISYLVKSARNWKAKFSSLVGSGVLIFGSSAFVASCNRAVNESHDDFYLVTPFIIAGITGIGYWLQPKKHSEDTQLE
jgi:hypothetical protein